mmetsp:Transcript_86968/g.202471  ORF Transcript_86968/g.202471 Transcript_86968/m.202471 type:complete len:337 (+) Transcript_86968:70-1080(+)
MNGKDGNKAQDQQPIPRRWQYQVDGLVHKEEKEAKVVDEVAPVLGEHARVDKPITSRKCNGHVDGVDEAHTPAHSPWLVSHEPVHAAMRARLPNHTNYKEPHRPIACERLANRPAVLEAKVVAHESQQHEVKTVEGLLPQPAVPRKQAPGVEVDHKNPPCHRLLRREHHWDGHGQPDVAQRQLQPGEHAREDLPGLIGAACPEGQTGTQACNRRSNLHPDVAVYPLSKTASEHCKDAEKTRTDRCKALQGIPRVGVSSLGTGSIPAPHQDSAQGHKEQAVEDQPDNEPELEDHVPGVVAPVLSDDNESHPIAHDTYEDVRCQTQDVAAEAALGKAK